ncbi:Abi family protein [Xanthomonas graminis]|uniref:Abortive infection bacteriophage resistance protein n=1 Tax=Xanthomonas graminis pv. phlei TaxID=487906 RepID=A0A0K3A4U5_9XANT|nr:Abi family protein [Xanthomonas translucens]UKE65607.1 Abi family protein [Xanthomonas translucens pv. phlei]CTP92878.1 Abortive infection bacteriophage resistance protein [Xanthomonas translucens pv. phlei]
MSTNHTYSRPWKSFVEQLALLHRRGLLIEDEGVALMWLQRVGYYRLSAYWYPFRVFQMEQDAATGEIRSVRTDDFVPGTVFSDAIGLYLFDRTLRALLADALERIEVSLRVEVAYRLGSADTFAHLHEDSFHTSFRNKPDHRSGRTAFAAWQLRHQGLVQRSKEDFVKHYREKHGPNMPIWVAIEVWDFGSISQLLAMIKVADQAAIAARYGIEDWKVFASWVRALSYLRNLVAHHSRVWNRNMVSEPKLPPSSALDWCEAFIGKPDLLSKPFVCLAIVRHMLERICPGSRWRIGWRSICVAFLPRHPSGNCQSPAWALLTGGSARGALTPDNKNPRVGFEKPRGEGHVANSVTQPLGLVQRGRLFRT